MRLHNAKMRIHIAEKHPIRAMLCEPIREMYCEPIGVKCNVKLYAQVRDLAGGAGGLFY